uniref:Uncharacterized protein n=1 Tax=viral metagenome TaxID=1070528 RepID=A0A6C0HE60_9ZZZZ
MTDSNINTLEIDYILSDTRKRKIPCRREVLILSLQKFYNQRNDLKQLIPILQGEGDISLRLIDWFVTNYAKKYHVSYTLNNQDFVVYLNYKSQLKAYSKKLFDPFCRRERILFQCGSYEPFETTVGQLNFFRWAFEKDILPYMRTHLQDIIREERLVRISTGTQSSTDSSQSTQSTQSTVNTVSTQSIKTVRRRRIEKTQSSVKMLLKQDTIVHLSFD